MGNNEQTCECGRHMVFVEDVPFDASGSGSHLIVPVASAIYECPEHGLLRIGVDGSRRPVKKRITPRPRDYILVSLGKEQAHVDKITADGARIRVRPDVLPFDTAREIVRLGACEHGGRMLICHVSTPDDVELL